METKSPSTKQRKQIVFNVSAEDHELIKKTAAKKRMPMKDWIINAMADSIKRDVIDADE